MWQTANGKIHKVWIEENPQIMHLEKLALAGLTYPGPVPHAYIAGSGLVGNIGAETINQLHFHVLLASYLSRVAATISPIPRGTSPVLWYEAPA